MGRPPRLKLYVAGDTARSARAIANLRAALERVGDHELTIVDVFDHPEEAEEAKLLATPACIKLRPGPVRHVVGDLGDIDAVLAALDLKET